MTRQTIEERTLAAEARAVEEGHRARLDAAGGCILVKSDSSDWTYHVRVIATGDRVVFECDHIQRFAPAADPERSLAPCKHGAVAARRLEREGLLRWEAGRWVPGPKVVAQDHNTVVTEDGRIVSCSCGWGRNIASTDPSFAEQLAARHREAYMASADVFDGLPS